ncbi:MAG: transcriptional repressor [Deltaproteobacteria bacterium]|nr:transcriptional repressor [Deltaproteobacteria bacterium]
MGRGRLGRGRGGHRPGRVAVLAISRSQRISFLLFFRYSRSRRHYSLTGSLNATKSLSAYRSQIGVSVKVDKNEVERRVERFQEAAKKAGFKLTHQRLEIFREVAGSADHPSAEAVLRALKPRMPTVSLDTVYRTLWLLNDLGLVSTLGPKRESVRFDANTTHHHHYVCVCCGLARDFESAELNSLRIPESVVQFGSIDATHVEVRGVCNRCAKEQTEKSEKNNIKPKGKERNTI